MKAYKTIRLTFIASKAAAAPTTSAVKWLFFSLGVVAFAKRNSDRSFVWGEEAKWASIVVLNSGKYRQWSSSSLDSGSSEGVKYKTSERRNKGERKEECRDSLSNILSLKSVYNGWQRLWIWVLVGMNEERCYLDILSSLYIYIWRQRMLSDEVITILRHNQRERCVVHEPLLR